MNERQMLEKSGWLNQGEIPYIKRFAFRSINKNLAPDLNTSNEFIRNLIAKKLIDNEIQNFKLSDFISENEQDLLLSEIDRYGLPLRTVINLKTGLVRSDPYYTEEWLKEFYQIHYRSLYTSDKIYSKSVTFAEQITRGQKYYDFVKDHINHGQSVLEIGCGMGGILVPFKINGLHVEGIDYGEDYINVGRMFNLNLHTQEMYELSAQNKKYDLIILSHVIEHIPDLEKFMQTLKNLLNNNGKVFIAVPGIMNIHLAYNDFLEYIQNAHCWSFSKGTLSNTLRKLGFTIVAINEEINCLASLSDAPPSTYNFESDSKNILKYLKKIELKHLIKTNKEKTKYFLKNIFKIK